MKSARVFEATAMREFAEIEEPTHASRVVGRK